MMNLLVVGDGRLGATLAAVADGAVAFAWAPVEAGSDAAAAGACRPAWAVAAGAAVAPDWREALGGVDAVAVDLAVDRHWHMREVVAETALATGKAVLVDAPVADHLAVYDRILEARTRGGGRLWSVRPLRRTLAVEAGARAIRSGAVGRPLALYAALRLPVGGGGASFEQAWTDLLDAALMLAGPGSSAPERLGAFAVGGEGGFDAVQAVGRLADGVVLTLEVAHCLTAAAGEGREALFEVTGEEGLVRLRPDASAVRIAGDRSRRVAWREDPLAAACEAFLAGADDGDEEAVGDRRVIAALRMLKRARATGEIVAVGGGGAVADSGSGRDA
jgi:predicted dehydrogenase